MYDARGTSGSHEIELASNGVRAAAFVPAPRNVLTTNTNEGHTRRMALHVAKSLICSCRQPVPARKHNTTQPLLHTSLMPITPPTSLRYHNAPVGITLSKPLAELRYLNVTFGAQLVSVRVTPRCGAAGSVRYCTMSTCNDSTPLLVECLVDSPWHSHTRTQCGPSGKLDYGYGVVALTASNLHADQSLFYQVIAPPPSMHSCAPPTCLTPPFQIQLYDTRQSEPKCNLHTCSPTTRSWFFPVRCPATATQPHCHLNKNIHSRTV